MNTQDIQETLESRNVPNLRAIARSCKRASLCGPYSKLDKPALVALLLTISPERLREYINPSLAQRLAVRWKSIGAGGFLLTSLIAFACWMWPRSTINDNLAAANILHAKNEARQLEEIKSLRIELTETIKQADRLAAGVADVVGSMSMQSREIRRSAQRLAELLSAFRSSHTGEELSASVENELRQAQATIDLANGKFDEVLSLISDADLNKIIGRADAAQRELLPAAFVRALALQGLGRWDDAIEIYSRVSRFDTTGQVRIEAAICLFSSGRSSDALGILDEFLAAFEAVSAQPEAAKIAAAAAYKARGVVYGSLGRDDEAARDMQRAVTLLSGDAEDPKLLIAAFLDLAIYLYDRDPLGDHQALEGCESRNCYRGRMQMTRTQTTCRALRPEPPRKNAR